MSCGDSGCSGTGIASSLDIGLRIPNRGVMRGLAVARGITGGAIWLLSLIPGLVTGPSDRQIDLFPNHMGLLLCRVNIESLS
jgi:hypothetical protein